MKTCPDNFLSEQKKKYAISLEKFRKIFSEELCMAESSECSGGIVRSHTVSRLQYLSNIAENDHVLQWKHSPWSNNEGDLLSLDRKGVRDASTFNGFCNHHDTKLFSQIDQISFHASPQQLFEQVYRAHAREVYCKRAQIIAFPDPKMIADFHGFENPEFYGPSPDATLQHISMEIGFRDTVLHHSRLINILKLRDFRRLRSCIIPLNGVPIISVAGAFFPDFSASGEELQDFTDPELILNTIHYNILPTNSVTYAVFSFLDIEAAGPEQFIQSILNSERLADMLVWIAFTYIENIQVRPSWWNSLNEECKNAIKSAFSCNIDLEEPQLLTASKYPGLQLTELTAGMPFWL